MTDYITDDGRSVEHYQDVKPVEKNDDTKENSNDYLLSNISVLSSNVSFDLLTSHNTRIQLSPYIQSHVTPPDMA